MVLLFNFPLPLLHPASARAPNPLLCCLRGGSLCLGLPRRNGVRRFQSLCFYDPDQPILKEALKEPVAFMGGVFAGLLRLDLNEDPLKEWVSRTAEAAGIAEEGFDANGGEPEKVDAPQRIDIE